MTSTEILEFPQFPPRSKNYCYTPRAPSVLSLPDDVLDQIVFYLTNGTIDLSRVNFHRHQSKLPQYTSAANNAVPNFAAVLALSSTCTYLRKYLGPVIFRHISLIRENHTDAILAVPKSLQSFSMPDLFYRQLVRETLHAGFKECSTADWAKSGLKTVEFFKSRYQTSLSLNHFCTHLECGRDLVSSGNLNLFHNVRVLKLLEDCSELPQTIFIKLDHLRMLSTNICSLSAAWAPLLPQLERLDLFCDCDEVSSAHMNRVVELFQAHSQLNLTELNLFIDEAAAITYEPLISLISSIAQRAPLTALGLRVARRSYISAVSPNWTVLPNSGEALLTTLQHCQLTQLTLEMSLLNHLQVPEPKSCLAPRLNLVLVEQSLVTPRFANDIKQKLLNIVQTLGVNQLDLKYGDPMSQSDLVALKVILDFIDYVSLKSELAYKRIESIIIEQCWSTAEDTLSRSLIRDIIVQAATKPEFKQRLLSIKPWDRSTFNSPRYRTPVTCRLDYSGTQINLLPGDEAHGQQKSKKFWSLESSLVELEQYTRKQKQLSSIWA